MRSLVWFFVLLFSLDALALPMWMSEDDIALSNSQSGSPRAYRKQRRCMLLESSPCHRIDGHDLLRESIGQVRAGNWEAPSEAPQSCDDPTDCQAQMGCTGGLTAFWGDLDSDGNLETWCTQRALVNRLVPDATLAAAADAADSDRADRRAQRVTARSQLRNAVRNWDTLTDPQQKQVLRHLVRLLLDE